VIHGRRNVVHEEEIVNQSAPRRSIVLKVLYWLLVVVIAAAVFVFFLGHSGIGLWKPESFGLALTWSAPRPYAYRVLMPLAGDLIAPLLGPGISQQLAAFYESILGKELFRIQMDGAAFASQVAVILTLMYASLVGFAASIWRLLRDLGYARLVCYLHAPVLMIGSLSFFRGFGNMYDLPLLFFFSLGLVLMLRRRWGWYLLVFGLATLNKETTIVLFLIFSAYFFSRLERRLFVRLSAWQLGLFAGLQGIVRFALRGNPGSALEWHLNEQITRAVQIASSPAYALAWAGAVIVLAIMVMRGWPQKPEFMRRALWIVPVFLVLAVFWGSPLELRGMLEIFPVLGILVLPPPLPNKGLPLSKSLAGA